MKLTHNDIESLANLIANQVAVAISAQETVGRWLKIPRACRYAKISKNTLMNCILSGDIRAKKRGKGGWIVDRLSIDEYNGRNAEELLYNDIARRAGL